MNADGFRVQVGPADYLAVAADRWAQIFTAELDVRLLIVRQPTGITIGAMSFKTLNEAVGATDLRHVPLGRFRVVLNAPTTLEWIDALNGTTTTFDPDVLRNRAAVAQVASSLPIIPSRGLVVPIPSGRRRPDSFYGDVVDANAAAIVWSASPAVDLAAANGVPLSTIHGWMKRARDRGYSTW